MSTRPDMRNYFRSRIDWHTHGMMAGQQVSAPRDVTRIDGDVTDQSITVTMRDGSTFQWSGGRYSTVKRNGCYAPLMPKVA